MNFTISIFWIYKAEIPVIENSIWAVNLQLNLVQCAKNRAHENTMTRLKKTLKNKGCQVRTHDPKHVDLLMLCLGMLVCIEYITSP